MKRWTAYILIGLLLAGTFGWIGPFAAAQTEHPITLTITPDPAAELEGDGTVSYLTFTLHNSSAKAYTLYSAKLTGGYENETLVLDDAIVVLGGENREFTLQNVAVKDAQLNTAVTYRLTWEERTTTTDELGNPTTTTAQRNTSASVTIPRFIPPELSVTAACAAALVRANEPFSVTYTITNDTKFDMSGLTLSDPTSGRTTAIELPKTILLSGETLTVPVEYVMGETDLSFCPIVRYTARQREMETTAATTLTVASFVLNVTITVQPYAADSEGNRYAVTIANEGNQTVTGLQLYDEINTAVDEPFDLAPAQRKVLSFSVPYSVSSGVIRKVQFHVTGVDCLGGSFSYTDPNVYDAVPFVDSETVNISLSVELVNAYYDANGKLCGKLQITIRNYSQVTLTNASVTELTLFGTVATYNELQKGETYYTVVYQLDGVQKLQFSITAYDPAGTAHTPPTIQELDLSGLAAMAAQPESSTIVYNNNTFLRDLMNKIRPVVQIVAIAIVAVAALLGILCLVLFGKERKLKAKLPPDWEHDMDAARKANRPTVEDNLFGDAPTEQFGYTAPAKLRRYGQLSPEEAAARAAKESPKSALSEQASAVDAAVDDDTHAVPVVNETDDAPMTDTRPVPVVSEAENAAVPDGATRFVPVVKKATPPVEEPPEVQAEEPILEQPPVEQEEEPVLEQPLEVQAEEPVLEELTVEQTEEPALEQPPIEQAEEPILEQPPVEQEEEPALEQPPEVQAEEPVLEAPVEPTPIVAPLITAPSWFRQKPTFAAVERTTKTPKRRGDAAPKALPLQPHRTRREKQPIQIVRM